MIKFIYINLDKPEIYVPRIGFYCIIIFSLKFIVLLLLLFFEQILVNIYIVKMKPALRLDYTSISSASTSSALQRSLPNLKQVGSMRQTYSTVAN
jgi:hypothetical protein